jgi:serine dehydrogenase proteinase
MPTWGEELKELNVLLREQQANPDRFRETSPYDILRRSYLKRLSERTGRATIVYATAWFENRPGLGSDTLAIALGDMQGFMEACSNIDERELDLILHSPGGSAEAADSIMGYLRTRFDHIRAVVPVAAMSAATMIALASDEIMMGAHSQLGPIDPQFTITTPEGPRSAPAQAIKDQFDLAKKECQDPANIGAWVPILRAYMPGLLAQCDHQRDLAANFAATALEKYMFDGEADAKTKAEAAAAWFADFTHFRSHGRRVSREEARAQGLKVADLEDDQGLQDALLSVHHAVQHTFTGTAASKVIENHHGRAWIQQTQIVQVVQGPAPAQLPGGAPLPAPNYQAAGVRPIEPNDVGRAADERSGWPAVHRRFHVRCLPAGGRLGALPPAGSTALACGLWSTARPIALDESQPESRPHLRRGWLRLALLDHRYRCLRRGGAQSLSDESEEGRDRRRRCP